MSLQRLPRIVAGLVLIASIAMPAVSFAGGNPPTCEMDGHRCGQQLRGCCCQADADPVPAHQPPARALTAGSPAVSETPPFAAMPADDDHARRAAHPEEDVPRHPHGSARLVVLLSTLLI